MSDQPSAVSANQVQTFSAIAGLCLAGALMVAQHIGPRRVAERHFFPGELGRVQIATGQLSGERGDVKASAYLTRWLSGVARDEAGNAWAAANGVTRPLAFSHNLSRIFPPALHAEHPEFFPLENGKRIAPPPGGASWNPDLGREDVAAWAAEAARKHFEANPDAMSFAVGVNDGLVFGESAETMAALARGKDETPKAQLDASTYPGGWFRERPDFSNLVFQFTNRAAASVAETHPEKYVGALAYYWAENAPEFPLHPNVIPFLTADRSQGYDRAFWEEELALQRRWAARAGLSDAGSPISAFRSQVSTFGTRVSDSHSGPPRRLGLYDYLYGNGFLVPRIHTRLIAEHLRHARRVGFTDYYAEVYPNWGLDGPMPWLVAQCLLDPEQSPEGLLEQYYTASFGAAAPVMRRFFELCEHQWMTQRGRAYWLKHFRNESQATLFPTVVCERLRVLLEQARRSARRPAERARVELVSAAFGVTERFVGMQEAREALVRSMLKANSWQQILAEAQLFVERRAEFIRYTKVLQERQPLAVAPFNWEDYLRHDPLSSALRVAMQIAQSEGMEEVARKQAEGAGEAIRSAWTNARLADEQKGGVAVLREAAMEGNIRPARTIAGLRYGVALPESWVSYVEPAQWQRTELVTDAAGGKVLRFVGNKETSVYQWNVASVSAWYLARVRLRGQVSPGGVVNLLFGWMDAKRQRMGIKTVQLPEGEWPEWGTFQLVESCPEGAEWVAIGVRVQNQQDGDWAEASGIELMRFDGLGQ